MHLRDMLSLKEQHPQIYEQFACGKFTISKSDKKFSSISVDQAHEQLNALIKGTGGAIGLTENEGALCRWITAGPEVMHCLLEFEGQFSPSVSDFKSSSIMNQLVSFSVSLGTTSLDLLRFSKKKCLSQLHHMMICRCFAFVYLLTQPCLIL